MELSLLTHKYNYFFKVLSYFNHYNLLALNSIIVKKISSECINDSLLSTASLCLEATIIPDNPVQQSMLCLTRPSLSTPVRSNVLSSKAPNMASRTLVLIMYSSILKFYASIDYF